MPRLVEKLRQLWESFWALPRFWKRSAAGGAILVFVALIVGVVLATGGGDNTAVGGVIRGPTPTARAPIATPTRVPTPTPDPTPTVVPNATPTPVLTATTSALGEQQPPSATDPPLTSAEAPTGPTPTPTAKPAPKPTPKPTPVPTPTPTPRLSYWILCLGTCVFLAPEIQCLSWDMTLFNYKTACASPWFPPFCNVNYYPYQCVPAPPGWSVICDGRNVGYLDNCDHSLDGSFSCSGTSEFGTFCISLSNVCSPPEQMPTYSIITCSRTDLGTEVTCIRASADYGPMFDCDSPTVGSFTCKWNRNNVFTCP